MVQFSRYIADKWNIPDPLSREVCLSYERGDAPFFLSDYHPAVAAELDVSQVTEIFDFLRDVDELSPKKKRLINALTKSDQLTPRLQERINQTISPFELDDMLAPHRVNPRSKGQTALHKGLGALADIVQKQEEERTPLEELAQARVGTDASLRSADDVLAGVKEILVERFAADETVRTMARDFAYEEAALEVTGKKRKVENFADIHEIAGERLLELFVAEDKKDVRLKLSIQLFRVTELLKQHFIVNPDSVGFDYLCEAIDECWIRYLQPLVERDVKIRLRAESEDLVARRVARELGHGIAGQKPAGTLVAAGAFDEKRVALVALDPEGHLLGATALACAPQDKAAFAERLRLFCARYRPCAVVVTEDQAPSPVMESGVVPVFDALTQKPPIIRRKLGDAERAIARSPWMRREFADLDEAMQLVFAAGLVYVKPPGAIPRIGIEYFDLHPLQRLLPPERMTRILSRTIAVAELHKGVVISRIPGSVLELLSIVPAGVLDELSKRSSGLALDSKRSLLSIPGMTATALRNMAGYVVAPEAADPLDRTLVHPEHFDWVGRMCGELDASVDMVIADPEILRSFACDDYVKKLFVERNLIEQLRAGQKYLAASPTTVRKRLKLTDVVEDSVVSGRVTNVTPFGVFVDINAVCDGLIHISQLADGYVESPEQVVSVNDRVNVRVVKVDIKKRRISLSMKNLGHLAPKVKPSKGQLNTLADYFKNR